ncbi:MAG: 2-dehydropantoate 2-reductase [FCB group bacterium]|nr:2-dehydropantoate 2-reductase [FCB group bacterium]
MTDNNNNGQMRVGVIGMGPVGAVLMAHLIEAGAFVVPCDIIPKKMDKIKKSGIILKRTIEKRVEVPAVCNSIQELEMYDLDLAIIAVKTPGLAKVVGKLAQIKSDKMYVLCAQNGIDNELIVAQEFGDEKTLRMVVNYAGNMPESNIVHVSFFNPPNYIAALSPKGEDMAKDVVELMNKSGLDTMIPEDIQDFIWEKAILNAALSAVCAITRKTMKEVMDFQYTLELVEAIIDESVRVAEMEGIELGKKFRRFCVRYLKNAGHHKPSMLIDLENGSKTEIDQLNGRIVKYGRKHCLPTPLNQCVTALVHLLEYSVE